MIADRHAEATGAGPGHEPDDLVHYLEPDQLVLDKARPVERAVLSPRARLGLWALRVFVLVISAMVIYTFFANLG